jgi:hypothetical protein
MLFWFRFIDSPDELNHTWDLIYRPAVAQIDTTLPASVASGGEVSVNKCQLLR